MAQRRVNWDMARAEYVKDPTKTHYDIADKFGVSFRTVKKMASQQKWTQERQKVSDRTAEKVVEKTADQLAEVNERHTQMYKNMQALGLTELNIALENIREAQAKARRENRKVNFDSKEVMGQQRLKFLFDGLKVAMDGERITLGLPTSVAVNKNENNNKDSSNMFEDVDNDDLATTLARAVEAIGRGDAETSSAENPRPSSKQSS